MNLTSFFSKIPKLEVQGNTDFSKAADKVSYEISVVKMVKKISQCIHGLLHSKGTEGELISSQRDRNGIQHIQQASAMGETWQTRD